MKRFVSVLLLFALLTLAGCGGRQSDVPETSAVELPAEEETQEDKGLYQYLPEAVAEEAKKADDAGLTDEEKAAAETERLARREQRLRDFVGGLSIEQKVGQLFFVRCAESGMEEKIPQYHLGGVLLFGRDFKDTSDNWLTREAFAGKLEAYQTAGLRGAGVPLFIGSDEEGGTVTRASRNPNLFPAKSKSPQELFVSGGLNAILSDTAKKSNLLTSVGINVNFAPVCDVSTDPGDFIYERSFGQNAAATMAYAAGVVSVMRDSNIGSVLKHFPGYGNNVDTHTGIAIDERPIETFRKSDFLPFMGGIKAGAPFVLVSHNVVNCMDACLPASLSPAVHDILRNELGFHGVILTDDLAMDAVKAYAEDGSVAVMALLAGNDMLVTTDFETQIPQVIAAVEDGTIPMSAVDAAVLRVMHVKDQLGLLDGLSWLEE